ncbi:hypothetical protein BKA62DRAFT_806688 [Auriculariales sp. MPI-PUGE-AT-0066]|nr:hypothetical protein BKA62DRAFT_806688 [Auriculariales sp. MPI-PUGE-AT-0066]
MGETSQQQQILCFRERTGITTALHVTLQAVLDRIHDADHAHLAETFTDIRETVHATLGMLYCDLDPEKPHGPPPALGRRLVLTPPHLDHGSSSDSSQPSPITPTTSCTAPIRGSAISSVESGALVAVDEYLDSIGPFLHKEARPFTKKALAIAPPKPTAHISRAVLCAVKPQHLSREILVEIFHNLISAFDPKAECDIFRPGQFTMLTRASHVCTTWRMAATRSTSLWTNLHSLSVHEMEHLDELLSRSQPRPIQLLSLQFITQRKLNFYRVCNALAPHIKRVVNLRVMFNYKQQPVFKAFEHSVRYRDAPLLKSFRLDFNSSEKLMMMSASLFNGQAPRLEHVTIRPEQLAALSKSIWRSVTSLELLHTGSIPCFHEIRLASDLCPALKELVLPHPLLDADRAHSEWAAPTLRRLSIHEVAHPAVPAGIDPYELMVDTLKLFRHRAVDHIELHAPHRGSRKVILAKLDSLDDVRIVIDANQLHVVIRSCSSSLHPPYTRVFTHLPREELVPVLRDLHLGHITHICLPLYAAQLDWDVMFDRLGHGLRELRTLQLLVPAKRPASTSKTMSIFSYTADRWCRWEFPNLSRLEISRRACEVDVPTESAAAASEPAVVMTIDARYVLEFLRKGLGLNTALRHLVVRLRDGVRFLGSSAGPDVKLLCRAVGEVLLEN